MAGPEQVEQARARGVILDAELDPTTGSVILPYDRFNMTHNEEILIRDALSVLVSQCAAESGVSLELAKSTINPIYDSESFYGPWTTAQAERFGFVHPMSDADLAANGLIDRPSSNTGEGPERSDLEQSVFDECVTSDSSVSLEKELQVNVGPWAEPMRATEENIFDDPAAKAALNDLNACFERGGMEPNPEAPFAPVGADSGTIDETQIGLALATVNCKNEVDFTQRVADAVAARQAPIIVTYLDELVAQRTSIDAALERAQTIMESASP